MPNTQMPAVPRSWLFVPASEPLRIDKAVRSDADAVVIDLEDSVADELKQKARAILASLDTLPAEKQVWVRVNSRQSGFFEHDLAAASANRNIRGVLIPKVEEQHDLASQEQLSAGRETPLEQAILVESALGVMNLHALLQANRSVSMVMFGGAENGDLMTDLQCAWSLDGPELLHARQHTLMATRAARVIAVDGVFSRIDDAEGLRTDCQLSRRIGYRSRAVVSLKQIAPVNEVYSPTATELAWARKIVAAFDEALTKGQAALRLEGRLVDYAMYKAAQQIAQRHPSSVQRDPV